MSEYLDPKADVVFKKIFGDHPHLLISFLNAVLPFESNDEFIVKLSYLPTEQVPEIPEFRRTIADVKCTDCTGRVFIVEMQMNWTDSFKQRLLFGVSRAYVKQLGTGQEFNLLQPVYGLGLIAEIYEKTIPEWYHHYQLIKKGSDEGEIIDHLQLIFIELPKFPVQSPDEKKLRLLWLRFLREIDEKTTEVSKDLLDVPEIAEAITLAKESAYTPSELTVYESYWDQVSREKTLMVDKYTEGLAKGEAVGEARGEELATHRIAKSMLECGIEVDMVMKSTGLTREDVEKIKDS
jgi:predicted transposase/invertase (TIGR01784 family)